jgi:hypothetical protein
MGALGIAFDTIIVGALALPWVLLVLHLFFSDTESSIKNILGWVKDQNQPAVAGVLLFAMAYPLGSAVSRIAQDFFDDGDLHVQISRYLFQVGVTETSIRTDVYCQTLQRGVVAQKPGESSNDKREHFRENDSNCEFTARWIVPKTHDWISDQQTLANDMFHVQEAALLLKGTDATERVRLFHDQIMVLRGAAFDGLLAFSLGLFWWSARFRSRLRWAVLLLYLVPGAVATINHFRERAASDPPYMEFTLLALAAAGWCVLWQRRVKSNGAAEEPGSQTPRVEARAVYLVLALFLTAAAFLGWWATQVLYDQQVIYSYKALTESPVK